MQKTHRYSPWHGSTARPQQTDSTSMLILAISKASRHGRAGSSPHRLLFCLEPRPDRRSNPQIPLSHMPLDTLWGLGTGQEAMPGSLWRSLAWCRSRGDSGSNVICGKPIPSGNWSPLWLPNFCYKLLQSSLLPLTLHRPCEISGEENFLLELLSFTPSFFTSAVCAVRRP